ncbi:zinc finger and SCAN domain-containing protein 21-like isoform X2 [Toxorhynchites rutilus septentrionalis]|uniref:zinc finger and SCAN domain-containing protein 21-like isoform X2 n=1 Tax=Toxorhynchites rutilus septentrionalis TaxID=329112 RepID=UPI002478EE0D|nr:zinc finger and SCAN domain-containing protein 21-like isoform X2 [Toxorhynchites rutilus septentrionalis]
MALVSNNLDQCSFCSQTCNEKSRYALVPTHHQEQQLKPILQKLSSFTSQLSSYPTCDKCHQEFITVHNISESCFLILPSVEPTAIKMEPELMIDDHKLSDNENIFETGKIEEKTETLIMGQNGELFCVSKIDEDEANQIIIPVARANTQRKSDLDATQMEVGYKCKEGPAEEGERSHPCPHCSKAFRKARYLKEHIRTHTGERPYTCPHCPKAFPQTSNLKIHIRTHTGERPFSCPHCPKTFNHHTRFKEHMRTHTGEGFHSCPHCSKAFHKAPYLKEHIRSHTGERPYSCSHCSKVFRHPGTLRLHMRKHMGGLSYSCPQCPKVYRSSGGYYKHLRSHTGWKERKSKLSG